MTKPALRKQVGNWGENRIDDYLRDHNWQILERNKKFRGAEIDRVYGKHGSVLYAEVKLFTASNKDTLKDLQYEHKLCSFLRPKQISNLHRFYQRHKLQFPVVKPYFRLFIVTILQEKVDKETAQQLKNVLLQAGYKICQQKGRLWILSLTPEFVPRGKRSTFLQAEID